MTYLETHNVVHRDLALRNLLITHGGSEQDKYMVKIGDLVR